MTAPDPVRASFEAWAAANTLLHPFVNGPAACDEYAFRAYLAAATRRDALTELEREYLEAAYAHEMDLSQERGTCKHYADPDNAPQPYRSRVKAFLALRLRRTPPKVDHLAEALRDLDQHNLKEVRAHIEAAITERSKP